MSKNIFTFDFMKLSLAEENYLKAIYHLSDGGDLGVSTNAIAEELSTKPASVSDMIPETFAERCGRLSKI